MIGSVLVANRGEIARRVFATCARLGIGTVAVFSDADEDAPFVREADLAVRLPGSSPAQTYLRGDLIVAAALASGADAIHPGYGFLSENAGFARAVIDAGLTWIGPAPETIEEMASKVRAKELMAAAGVPVLAVDPATARQADYPLLVKASAGGGGRGMRVVDRPEALEAALADARAEAASAFGDGTVFVEPYLPTARHIEVQVLADEHGTCLVLGERDCSIQRRHQKVVEESPAPGISDAVRTTLHDAARAAVEAVGYVGAGTVELLVEGAHLDDGYRVAFLEMNTRLQVEHPVTECVTGLDLVALQIEVAEGRRLDPEVPAPDGHAIEVRLYAEDPADDWAPQTGVVRAFEVPGEVSAFANPPSYGLRVDSGVSAGSEVGIHYDAMLAKVVAWGSDREQAVRILAAGLRRARIHGVVTNRDLLLAVLSDDDFAAGHVHTGLLDERLGSWVRPRLDQVQVHRYAVAAALAEAVTRRAAAPVQVGIPAGFRNVPSQPISRAYTHGTDRVVVAYTRRRGRFVVGGATVRSVTADRVRLEVAGVVETYDVSIRPAGVDVDGPRGGVSFGAVPRFVDPTRQVAPGSLLAPMPAAVTSVAVEQGAYVDEGQTILVLEAMKMQHTLRAPHAGVVTALSAVAGAQIASGAVLAVIDADTPTTAPGTDEGNPR